jgi:hypothetical protein
MMVSGIVPKKNESILHKQVNLEKDFLQNYRISRINIFICFFG